MEFIESRTDFSIQSNTVNTEMMQKIPIVIPKSERKVRNLLTTTDLTANKIPSINSLTDIFEIDINISTNAKGKKIIWI